MQWLQIRAGFASSRRKKESSLHCKISIFSLVKAAPPNSLQRTHPVECRCWSSTTGHVSREQAQIEMWNRRMELELFAAIGRTIQNTSPIFQGRYKQFPDCGEAQRAVVHQRLERMDRELNGREFVAGDRFTIADITALVAIDIGGRLADIKVAPELSNLSRWHKAVSSRPSAKA